MSILVVGDTHFPFHNGTAMGFILDEIAENRSIEKVIQVGDLYDFYAFSKYPRKPDVMTPHTEIYLGRSVAEDFWAAVRSIAKRQHRGIKCYQMKGNHDTRAVKRIMERANEFSEIVEDWLNKRMEFPGVELVPDEFVMDGIMFQHGFRKHGEHATYNQMNTVCGHSHRGGVSFFTNLNGTYWELNAGWIGDLRRKDVFDYQSQKRISGTTLGYGLIDELGPRFVPL